MKLGTKKTAYVFQHSGFTTDVLFDLGPERERCERDLSEAGVPLPLPHRSTWAQLLSSGRPWFVRVRDAGGTCCCGFALEVADSRVLPGHLLLRVERFSAALTSRAREAGLRALTEFARRYPRVLRVYLEVFSRDPAIREQVARTAMALGFRRQRWSRLYTATPVLDLTRPEPEILSSLHPTGRRHIRALDKKGFALRRVSDLSYGNRMDMLLTETMARTGGQPTKHDWVSMIEFSNRYPALSRLAGTFEPDVDTPEDLVAFAWGTAHGDHATYSTAASTRRTGSKVPVGYGPMWDLIRWAKLNGCTWFDLGGITPEIAGNEDPLRGISDFKQFFSKEVVQVGEEWILEPNPVRGRLSRALSGSAAWLRAKVLRR